MGEKCAECGKAMTKPQYEKCYNCMRGIKPEEKKAEDKPKEVVALCSDGKKYRLVLELIPE